LNYNKILPTFILFLFCLKISAQEIPKQIIRGIVTDAFTGQALVGASVLLPGTTPIKGTTTDENGRYRLEDVLVGRYSLEATYIGYELLEVPEVLVESGKELILNIALYEQSESLDEVIVKSSRRQSGALAPVSVQSITVEEVLRFPATFNDPARLAATYPGVVNTNDQANHISVRGNSPNSTSWRLEGVEIVNPNHLGDAGTSSGRPSISGGGVNILSAQLLGTSNFYSSVFPVEYGNAIGGIMDMRFRNGNDEKQEFTAQAGLVGFDFSAEGPLSKKKGISYLVNYRYSFVGLLTAMGVDFGGEAISFQDLSFNLNVPLNKNSTLKVFGMGGASKNIFTGKENSEDWTVDKDRFNISFTNRMGALGARYSTLLNDKLSMNATIISSALQTNKQSDLMSDSSLIKEGWAFDSITYRKIALQTNVLYKLRKKHHLKAGLSAVEHFFDINTTNFLDRSFGQGKGWLLGTFIKWHWMPISKIKITTGLHYTHFTYTESQRLEPRATFSWQASPKDRFSLAAGMHSQIQPGQVYLVSNGSDQANKELDFTESIHYVLSYKRELNSYSELSMELYYQQISNDPIHINTAGLPWSNNFSNLNQIGDFKNLPLVNDGVGANYGVELNWQRFIHKDYFLLANTSIYRSVYEKRNGEMASTRFDGRYLFNLTGGKEFNWTKKSRQKTLGINARLTYAGGLRRSPIAASSADLPIPFATLENNDLPFSIKQKDYFKIDFRIYLKNNKSKYNSTLALDLQNITNRKNDGYYYYDHVQDEVLAQKQLGLIPNLSYRLEF
jgi:hypothetical protein